MGGELTEAQLPGRDSSGQGSPVATEVAARRSRVHGEPNLPGMTARHGTGRDSARNRDRQAQNERGRDLPAAGTGGMGDGGTGTTQATDDERQETKAARGPGRHVAGKILRWRIGGCSERGRARK